MNTNPICDYLTLEDKKETKRRKPNDNDGGVQYFKSVSMYNIKNAFLERFILLSDNIHDPFRMMPPELLHTSGSGLKMYMFESLRYHLGGGIDRDYIDQEHVGLVLILAGAVFYSMVLFHFETLLVVTGWSYI